MENTEPLKRKDLRLSGLENFKGNRTIVRP